MTFTTGSSTERLPPGWPVPVSYFVGVLVSIEKGLAVDMRPRRVNVVSMGAIDTKIWKMETEVKEGFFAGMAAKLLMGGVGRVEDIAKAYLDTMRQILDRNIDFLEWRCSPSLKNI